MTGEPLTAEEVRKFAGWAETAYDPHVLMGDKPSYKSLAAKFPLLADSHELMRARLEQAERERDAVTSDHEHTSGRLIAARKREAAAEAALVQARQALRELDVRNMSDYDAALVRAALAADKPGAEEPPSWTTMHDGALDEATRHKWSEVRGTGDAASEERVAGYRRELAADAAAGEPGEGT